MRRLAIPLWTLLAAASVACGGTESTPQRSPDTPEATEPGNFRGRVYERNFVFTTLSGDSAFLVPWLITAETRPGAVDRQARGFLARGNSWENFYNETWETPPSRAPWRIIPHGSLRLVVGDGDAVEGIIFSEGPRQLELELSGGALMEWTGNRGQIYRLLEGAAYLSDQPVDGIVLDMTRVHDAEETAQGDWAFLTSGDSLQVIFENPTAAPPGTKGGSRAWARLDFRDLRWPALTLDWADVRGFQPARQDVPVSFTITSDDDDMGGVLQVQSAQIQAGAGEGPLLPVDALFLVAGTLRIEGGSYPVRGLFRHTRP